MVGSCPALTSRSRVSARTAASLMRQDYSLYTVFSSPSAQLIADSGVSPCATFANMSTTMYFDPDSAAAGPGGAGEPHLFDRGALLLEGVYFGVVAGDGPPAPYVVGPRVVPVPPVLIDPPED